MNRVRCCLLVVALPFALSVAPVAAQEWTRFRGPNGTGISDAKTVPAEWTDKDYNWRVALPGVGHSSPVLWGDRIFLTTAETAPPRRMLLCLGAADGKILWQRDSPSRVHGKHRFNTFASSTPTVDKDRVYCSWATPESYLLMAYDHEGELAWRRDLGPARGQHGTGTSPIVVGDLVVIANDQEGGGFLIAVDKKSGATRWQINRPDMATPYATPFVHQRNGSRPELVFAASGHGFTGVDLRRGTVNWEAENLFDKRVCSSAVLSAGLVIGTCGSGGGGNFVVAVHPGAKGDAAKPKLAFKVTRNAPYVPTPLAKDGLLYLWSDGGIVSCLRGPTGEVIWTERVGGRFFGSPVCVDDKLYCVANDGEVVVVAAGETFKLLGRSALGEQSHSTPAVAGGTMVLRTVSHLFSIGGRK